ncbi:MAG: mucin desulfatase [Verrucomicrobiaceae bacterium]|mgnify:CR=1 FL=1|nr:mucin desulfatase [Verrucomicrobiaceae bacterium]
MSKQTSVQPLSPETADLVRGIADQFAIEGEYVLGEEVESGHINSTYLATYQLGDGECRRYILQRINEKVFKDPLAVMRNVECVTSHINWKVLRRKRDLGGQTLNLYPHKTGRFYGYGEGGGIWRCYNYFEGCRTYDVVENTRQAFEAGRAFGAFQNLVSDLPADEIVETIPDFHHTRKRFEALMEAVEKDACGRMAEVAPEVDFVKRNEDVVDRLLGLQETGALPLRITHNDTKINNVLFDVETDEAVCVIDLDTVMPGLSLYDFGDLVRTATNPAEEDERDLKKVQLRMGVFEALVEGYLSSAGGVLEDAEIAHMAFSGRLISVELGMRFLTDHLNGDQYFRVYRKNQNLDRARTQLRLAEQIAKHEEEMNGFVFKVAKGR